MGFNLEDKQVAKKVIDMYPSDDPNTSIVWDTPRFASNLIDVSKDPSKPTTGIGTDFPRLGKPATVDPDMTGEVSVLVYVGNGIIEGGDYEAGDQLDMLVVNSVETNTKNGEVAHFAGLQACGVLEFDGNGWQVSAQPTVFVDHVERTMIK